ncbi:MAG: SLBB domain-containing protein [Candidatus Rokubacteria bacterium]|nr:SLBB domain-containing protein [Candidatus Rokubacteria bacterium]
MISRLWLALALLGGTAGCAAPAPPVVPVVKASELTRAQAGPAATAPAVPPPAASAPEAVAPPVVTENKAFVTIDGVPRYKIGPGDVLEILLATGLTQERQTGVVKANGNIGAAFLEVKVGGLTTDQAGEAIQRQLAQFYRQIGVEVLVKEYNSKRITVLGAVSGKVGTLPLRGRMTLLDLLAEVGGPAANADLERVRIIRQEGPSLTLNLLRLLDEPVAQAFALDAGDVVFIPAYFIPAYGGSQAAPAAAVPGSAAALTGTEARVYILGEVKTPGAVLLVPNMRLSQALTLVGGPTDVAVLESARIIRGGLQNPQVVEANFRKLIEQGDQREDLPLQPNDLIVLPRSGVGNWNAFIAKIRPTLEVLTLPLALPVQINAISR